MQCTVTYTYWVKGEFWMVCDIYILSKGWILKGMGNAHLFAADVCSCRFLLEGFLAFAIIVSSWSVVKSMSPSNTRLSNDPTRGFVWNKGNVLTQRLPNGGSRPGTGSRKQTARLPNYLYLIFNFIKMSRVSS